MMKHDLVTIDLEGDQLITFGKFKGHTWKWLYGQYPQYVWWAHENVSWVTLKDEDIEHVRAEAELQKDLALQRAWMRSAAAGGWANADPDEAWTMSDHSH